MLMSQKKFSHTVVLKTRKTILILYYSRSYMLRMRGNFNKVCINVDVGNRTQAMC